MVFICESLFSAFESLWIKGKKKERNEIKTNHRRNEITYQSIRRDCVGRFRIPTTTATSERRKRKDIKLNYRRKWKPFMDNISLKFSGEMCAHVVSYKSITFTFWFLGSFCFDRGEDEMIGLAMKCRKVKCFNVEEGRNDATMSEMGI